MLKLCRKWQKTRPQFETIICNSASRDATRPTTIQAKKNFPRGDTQSQILIPPWSLKTSIFDGPRCDTRFVTRFSRTSNPIRGGGRGRAKKRHFTQGKGGEMETKIGTRLNLAKGKRRKPRGGFPVLYFAYL